MSIESLKNLEVPLLYKQSFLDLFPFLRHDRVLSAFDYVLSDNEVLRRGSTVELCEGPIFKLLYRRVLRRQGLLHTLMLIMLRVVVRGAAWIDEASLSKLRGGGTLSRDERGALEQVTVVAA